MARSGYEIRLDVLRIAKDLADDRYHQEVERRMHTSSQSNTDYELPADNREDETLKLANKFYSFVQESQNA